MSRWSDASSGGSMKARKRALRKSAKRTTSVEARRAFRAQLQELVKSVKS